MDNEKKVENTTVRKFSDEQIKRALELATPQIMKILETYVDTPTENVEQEDFDADLFIDPNNIPITLGEFRAMIRDSNQIHREECLKFRKSLYDIWDYNVVAGILLGSKIRHTTGTMHISEQNIGIGQGDNKNSVVKKLKEKELERIFDKYQMELFAPLYEVRDDILGIVPEYEKILNFIFRTFNVNV